MCGESVANARHNAYCVTESCMGCAEQSNKVGHVGIDM